MQTPIQRIASLLKKVTSALNNSIINGVLGVSDTHTFQEDRSIPLRRLGALLIDLTICGSIAVLITALSQLALFFLGCGYQPDRYKLICLVLFLLPLWFDFVLLVAQLWLIPAICESSRLQATPGMYLMRLVSFSITGSRLTFCQITGRLLIQWLVTYLCFSAINLGLHLKLNGQTLPVPSFRFGIGWLPIFSWALLTFFFAIALIRKDSRNIFDIWGKRIVQNASEMQSKPSKETGKPDFLNNFARGTIALILCGNLAGMVCYVVATIALNISGFIALEKAMHQADLLITKDSSKKELPLNAFHKIDSHSQFPQLIENYYYAKAALPVQIGKEEQLTLLSKAIVIKERGIFYSRRANLLQSLGRHREAILDYSKALKFAETGNDRGDILYSIPPQPTQTDAEPFCNISLDKGIYSKATILTNRGTSYLKQAESNKSNHNAQKLAYADFITAKKILSEELKNSPSADKYQERALINKSLGNIQEAIEDEQRAEKL